jgi:hypothetical protein
LVKTFHPKKEDQEMNKNKAFFNYISNHFSMHSARITIMLEIVLSLIKVGNVQQQKIAQGTKIRAKTSSIIRRIQRFFEKQFLCPKAASKFIFNLFTWEEKIILTLDRTNWKFGNYDINFLVIAGIYKNCSIPLCWTLLPHQGNSEKTSRINLIEKLLYVLPINRIRILLADREFIGVEWFQYLHSNNIPFCIRLKENMLVADVRRGGTIKLKNLFSYLSLSGNFREIQQVVSGVLLRIFATRINDGELLILAVSGDENLLDAFQMYRLRWTIETMFKAFKSSGFNFESTHQKNLDRLYKLMILLTISYAWAIKIGEIKNDLQPIRIKIHKRPEFSLFLYGFRAIQTILLKSTRLQYQLFQLLTNITLNQPFSSDLAKVTVVY